jgi:hypothetical protein
LQVAALPLLAPYAPRLHPAVEQLAACLEGLALVVERQQPPSRQVQAVASGEGRQLAGVRPRRVATAC